FFGGTWGSRGGVETLREPSIDSATPVRLSVKWFERLPLWHRPGARCDLPAITSDKSHGLSSPRGLVDTGSARHAARAAQAALSDVPGASRALCTRGGVLAEPGRGAGTGLLLAAQSWVPGYAVAKTDAPFSRAAPGCVDDRREQGPVRQAEGHERGARLGPVHPPRRSRR